MAEYTNGGIFGDSSLFEEFESVPLNEPLQSKQDEEEETFDANLKLKLADLERENDRLKKLLRNLFPPKGLHIQNTESGPIAQVLFMNNDISRKYRQEAEEFFEKMVARGESDNTGHVSGMIDIDSDDDDNCAIARPQRSSRVIINDDNEMRRDAYLSTGNVQYYQVFCIDLIGRPLTNGDAQLTGWFIPIYTAVFLEALPVDETAAPQRKSRPKNKCWNCDSEDHAIRDCPMPRNPAKINANKQLFQSQSTPVQKRYVTDGKGGGKGSEGDGKFNKFTPGNTSDDLREAMGIRENQLPPYIYMMRVHGYPPGWMREAEVETSGMKVYDIKPNEEGEVGDVENKGDNKPKYNAEKLVDYPGFNVPPPKNSKDEWRELGAPPMQKHHSREILEGYMTPPADQKERGQKRRGSFMNDTETKKQKSDRDDVDMDIASSETDDANTPSRGKPGTFKPPLPPTPGTASPLPPLPLSTPPATPDPPGTQDSDTPMPSPGSSTGPLGMSANVSQESSRSASPTVEDLELQQKQLMAALMDAGKKAPSEGVIDGMEEGEVLDVEENTQEIDDSQRTDNPEENVGPPGLESGEIIESPESPDGAMGEKQDQDRTEIISGDTPRTFKLHNQPELFKDISGDTTPNKSGIPRLSNFASGITPHEDESLAESTGVFQKLLGILRNKGSKSK